MPAPRAIPHQGRTPAAAERTTVPPHGVDASEHPPIAVFARRGRGRPPYGRRRVFRLPPAPAECDDGTFWTPSSVIVDGLTAIIGDPARYGEWYAQFKRLTKATDVPNALVTGRTAAGTSQLYKATRSMAGPDGAWSYTSERPHDPTSAKHFQVLPRIEGAAVPRTRVKTGEDGLLHVSISKSLLKGENNPSEDMSTADEEQRHNEHEMHVLARLAGGDALTTHITGEGRVSQERRRALLSSKSAGRVTSRAAANGKGQVWSLFASA